MILTFSYALKQGGKLAQVLYLIICGGYPGRERLPSD